MTDAAAWALRTFPAPFWIPWLNIRSLRLRTLLSSAFLHEKNTLFAIAAGIIFHLGIALFMDKLIFFSLQMMSFYVLFLPLRKDRE